MRFSFYKPYKSGYVKKKKKNPALGPTNSFWTRTMEEVSASWPCLGMGAYIDHEDRLCGTSERCPASPAVVTITAQGASTSTCDMEKCWVIWPVAGTKGLVRLTRYLDRAPSYPGTETRDELSPCVNPQRWEHRAMATLPVPLSLRVVRHTVVGNWTTSGSL